MRWASRTMWDENTSYDSIIDNIRFDHFCSNSCRMRNLKDVVWNFLTFNHFCLFFSRPQNHEMISGLIIALSLFQMTINLRKMPCDKVSKACQFDGLSVVEMLEFFGSHTRTHAITIDVIPAMIVFGVRSVRMSCNPAASHVLSNSKGDEKDACSRLILKPNGRISVNDAMMMMNHRK